MTSMKKLITATVLTGICSCSMFALAEEVYPDHTQRSTESEADTSSADQNPWILETDTTYDLDLDADGTAEAISFQSHMDDSDDQCKAILDLYVNGQQVWSATDENWSYSWRVCQCPLEDGSACLLAASISDNDWTNQTLLLARTEDSFQVLADLSDLSRETEENTDRLLSGWARADSILSADGTSFTVAWYDTLYSAGMMQIPVTYEVTDGTVTQSEDPVSLDESKSWTVWHSFDVLDAPESETLLYQATPGEILHLTGMQLLSGHRWLKCENESEQEGWFMDPEEFISETQEDGNMLFGYFEEAAFAG